MDKENNKPSEDECQKDSIWSIMTKKRMKGLTDTNIRIKEMLDANTRKQIENFANRLKNKDIN